MSFTEKEKEIFNKSLKIFREEKEKCMNEFYERIEKELEEFKYLSNEELRKRVKQNISFRCDNCEYEFGTEEAKLDYE